MGMGDKKKPYAPQYKPKRCDVTKLQFYSSLLRSCPEPNVRKRFHHEVYENNQLVAVDTTVCMYVCKKCKYHEIVDNCVICTYEGT